MFTNTALIISDQCPFTIKCATFDGDVKAPISERIELSGSMIRQLNDAMTFLNGHNRRDDGRQCPPDALREALVNAVLHRDYAFPGPTLVNIFPSRVEIVSLGGLMDGIEINDLLNGISQPRNPGWPNCSPDWDSARITAPGSAASWRNTTRPPTTRRSAWARPRW